MTWRRMVSRARPWISQMWRWLSLASESCWSSTRVDLWVRVTWRRMVSTASAEVALSHSIWQLCPQSALSHSIWVPGGGWFRQPAPRSRTGAHCTLPSPAPAPFISVRKFFSVGCWFVSVCRFMSVRNWFMSVRRFISVRSWGLLAFVVWGLWFGV